jgi:IMP dehydrogenase
MEHNFSLALTFDDVLLKPRYAGFSRSDIDLTTNLTKNITLASPLVASPMDTVTESKLAIALAKLGGIGFIHRNMSVEDQAQEVAIVKAQHVLVGAAVGSSPGFEKRVEALVGAGVDVILIDSAHGYSHHVIVATSYVKQHFSVDVVAGSVATSDGAKALIDAGADSLRVGMGPGAICSTRIISGMGMPQMTAILETVKVASRHAVPVIADGGITYSGDITKALAAGASTVMMGRIFAATLEAPGNAVTFKPEEVPARFRSIVNGAKEYTFKTYRGMGSVGAMKRGLSVSSEDEFHGKQYHSDDVLIAEGVEGLVPCSGPLEETNSQLLGGVRSGFYYVGAKTIPELWETAQFVRITQASLSESHPHNLFITDGGGNYN